MNNKIVKRFAAVVLGAAVLSTCAFASEITSADYAKTNAKLTYDITSAADKISYIAYAATAVDSATEGATQIGTDYYSLGNIVAVNQIDDHTSGSTGNTEVSIDSTKLAGATHIVLMSGDSNGAPVAKTAVLAIDEFAYSSNVTNSETLEVTIGDVTYSNCPNITVNVTANKGGKMAVTTLKKVVGGVESDFSDISGTLPTNVTVTAGSSYSIENIYVVGVPEGTSFSIKPVVTIN